MREHERTVVTGHWYAEPPTLRSSTVSHVREVNGILVADVDADRHLDIASTAPTWLTFEIVWGDGTCAYSAVVVTSIPRGRSGRRGAVGSIDGDAILVLLWGLQDSNELKIVRGPIDRAFAAPVSVPEADGPGRVELTDVNGDDDLDAFIDLRFGSRTMLRLGNVDGTFAPSTCIHTNHFMFDADDIDGDDLVELVTSEGRSASSLRGCEG